MKNRSTDTVLGRAASGRTDKEKEEILQPPWFRDPDRLMNRVFALVEQDPKLRRLLRAKIGKLASSDEEFRLELKKDLEETGNRKPGRRSPYGQFFSRYVVGVVDFFVAQGESQAAAFAKFAGIEGHNFPELTEDAVRGIYRRAKKPSKGT